MTETDTAPDASLNLAFAEWKKNVQAELNGVPFEKRLVTRTFEDIALQPLYTRADLHDVRDLATGPGEAPFLRGVRLPRGTRTWQAAQEIRLSQPSEYNQALLVNLERGQDAVVLTPDSEKLQGSDSVTADRGSGDGLALRNVADFATALARVDLRAVSVHMNAGADPRGLAALYLAYAQTQGVPFASLQGSVTGAPLASVAGTARFPGDLGATFDEIFEWTTWASVHAPQLDTIGIEAGVWGDAGATATQELAIAVASAAEYIRALMARGLPVDVIAERIRFKFSVGSQFFTELAKFRAFRPLLTRLFVAFGGTPKLAAAPSIAAATGHWNKTLLDPHVNLLRSTTEALSAVLGGCDLLHIAPFDEVSGSTTEFSRRIALNVHTLLAEEFGFAWTADPAGGSWYVEKLTDQIGRAAWVIFQDFERRGGLGACLRSGYAQEIVEKSRLAKATAVATRRLSLVGTNLFPNFKEKPLTTAGTSTSNLSLDRSTAPTLPTDQRPESIRAESPFEAAIDAARKGASLSRVAAFFEKSKRSAVPLPALKHIRAAEGFEVLRAKADALTARTGARPKVFLAKMGPSAQHKARADFSASFFAVGGFEVTAPANYEDAASAAAGAVKSGAAIVVLCSTDETYPTLAPFFASAVKAANPSATVVLAGLPSDSSVVATFRAAGFDEFIHARANVEAMLGTFLVKMGATP